MKAEQLLLPDGRPSEVLFCSDCKTVANDEATLSRMCKCPRTCTVCEETTVEDLYYTTCRSCRRLQGDKEREKKEAERFEKAAKILESDYEGPIFTEATGWNNGYFRDTSELREHLCDEDMLEEDEDGNPLPLYVWACRVNPICSLNLSTVLEHGCDTDILEDWDSSRLQGTDALQKALDAFNELNKDEVSWTPDYRRAIILEKNEPPHC